ncbi:hypothetical protein RyT2_07920 [Pseudolactococcus yaeyamensis]
MSTFLVMDKNTREVIEQCDYLSVAHAVVDSLEDKSLVVEKKRNDFFLDDWWFFYEIL